MSRPGELDETLSSDAGKSPTAPAATRTPAFAALPAMVSRFSILEKLGEGGMGIVMLASDPVLGRKVAIKILRDVSAGGDAERRQRFLREARAMAKVSHENVIVVHEVGTHEGRDYVAMEHVAGTTLARWQRDRGWREIVEIYLRAGRGLAAAHAAGLVHRDFKPDNVLIGDDGRVRVMDFGLVAAEDGEAATRPSAPPDLDASPLTLTGAVLGTPRYMAPEQHDGEAVDARADQFAFCVALYEALYGQRPFRGETYEELARAVAAGSIVAPPPSDVPPAVEAAVLRGLSTDRTARFAALPELLAVLEAAVAPLAPRRRAWPIVALAAAAVLIAVVAGVAYKLRGDASRSDARVRELAATIEELQLKESSPAPRVARAPESPLNLKHAEIEFADGQAAHNRGRYPEAAAAFLRAYEFQKFPAFLFNAGASQLVLYKKAGDKAAGREALRLFRSYLAESPDATDRATVERTIAALAKSLGE